MKLTTQRILGWQTSCLRAFVVIFGFALALTIVYAQENKPVGEAAKSAEAPTAPETPTPAKPVAVASKMPDISGTWRNRKDPQSAGIVIRRVEDGTGDFRFEGRPGRIIPGPPIKWSSSTQRFEQLMFDPEQKDPAKRTLELLGDGKTMKCTVAFDEALQKELVKNGSITEAEQQELLNQEWVRADQRPETPARETESPEETDEPVDPLKPGRVGLQPATPLAKQIVELFGPRGAKVLDYEEGKRLHIELPLDLANDLEKLLKLVADESLKQAKPLPDSAAENRHAVELEPVTPLAKSLVELFGPRGAKVLEFEAGKRLKVEAPGEVFLDLEKMLKLVAYETQKPAELKRSFALTTDQNGVQKASREIPAGMVVALVPIDQTTTNIGLIRPGNRVDVRVSSRMAGSPFNEVKTVLEYVEVFAIGDVRDPEHPTVKHVSLLVTIEQMLQMKQAGEKGTIHLALRHSNDETSSKFSDDSKMPDITGTWRVKFVSPETNAATIAEMEIRRVQTGATDFLIDQPWVTTPTRISVKWSAARQRFEGAWEDDGDHSKITLQPLVGTNKVRVIVANPQKPSAKETPKDGGIKESPEEELVTQEWTRTSLSLSTTFSAKRSGLLETSALPENPPYVADAKIPEIVGTWSRRAENGASSELTIWPVENREWMFFIEVADGNGLLEWKPDSHNFQGYFTVNVLGERPVGVSLSIGPNATRRLVLSPFEDQRKQLLRSGAAKTERELDRKLATDWARVEAPAQPMPKPTVALVKTEIEPSRVRELLRAKYREQPYHFFSNATFRSVIVFAPAEAQDEIEAAVHKFDVPEKPNQQAAESKPDAIQKVHEPTEQLAVLLGHVKALTTREAISRIAIAGTDIIDFNQLSETKIAVIGKGVGSTSLLLWLDKNPEPRTILVTVTRETSTVRLDTPAAKQLVEQLVAQESAAAEAATIRQLQANGQAEQNQPAIAEHQRKLKNLLSTAFDLKLQVEELQVKELQSRLSRLERQIGQRKELREKIINRRAGELIEGDALRWDSTAPVSTKPPGSVVSNTKKGATPEVVAILRTRLDLLWDDLRNGTAKPSEGLRAINELAQAEPPEAHKQHVERLQALRELVRGAQVSQAEVLEIEAAYEAARSAGDKLVKAKPGVPSSSTAPPTKTDHIEIDLYAGSQVLPGLGKNPGYSKLVQSLNALKGVTVNFREAGQGDVIVMAIVRDPSQRCQREARQTQKESELRIAINSALKAAGIEATRWDESAAAENAESKSANKAETQTAASKSDPKAEMLAKLQGRWDLDTHDPEGIPIFAEIKGDIVTIWRELGFEREDAESVQLKFGEPGLPQQIDLIMNPNDGESRTVVLGIIEFADDVVRICLNNTTESQRPEVFATGKKTSIWELRRKPKSDDPMSDLFPSLEKLREHLSKSPKENTSLHAE